MRCNSCGADLPDTATSCEHCGADLSAGTGGGSHENTQPTQGGQHNQSDQQQYNQGGQHNQGGQQQYNQGGQQQYNQGGEQQYNQGGEQQYNQGGQQQYNQTGQQAGQANQGSALSADGGFTETYGKAILTVVGLLLLARFPVVNLITIVPILKEVIIGALIVVVFSQATDAGSGIKYALVAGMTGSVLFTVVWIPLSPIVTGLIASGPGGGAVAGGAQALGALSNIIGLIIFSPLGYLGGGALGGVLN